MEYEIVTLNERIAAGISARTNNGHPDMPAVIGGLWKTFYDSVYDAIPCKAHKKALGIYTEYAGNEKSDYTAMVACETTEEPKEGDYAVCRIPAGRYARFVVRGHMVQAVAAAWQEIWQMDLPRSFQCDFEEYQNDCMDNGEIHIYVGLKEEKAKMKLEGFGIFVKDMAAMIRFYRDVLGFEIKEAEDTKNVYLEKDGTLFLLFGREDFENMAGKKFSYASGDSGHFEIALGVEDYAAVDKAFEEIVAKGGKPVMKPTTEPWGQRTCYIGDPEGNLVEIGSFNPGKPVSSPRH